MLFLALSTAGGANRGRPIDRIVKGTASRWLLGAHVLAGLLFLIVFSVQLRVVPVRPASVPIGASAVDVTFADALHHLEAPPPALTLSVIGVANIAPQCTRARRLSTLESDYAAVCPCAG